MDRYKNIPTAEEFNRKMDECVEYQKLNKLKEHLQWFRGKVFYIDITDLEKHIYKRIEEIPEESINFNHEVHGDRSINDGI